MLEYGLYLQAESQQPYSGMGMAPMIMEGFEVVYGNDFHQPWVKSLAAEYIWLGTIGIEHDEWGS